MTVSSPTVTSSPRDTPSATTQRSLIRTARPTTVKGPMLTSRPRTTPGPSRAVASTPGPAAAGGNSAPMTRTIAAYGSGTTTRERGPPGASASSAGTSTSPARQWRSWSAYLGEMAREMASGPALSSARMVRNTTVPSPSRRPPTRSATACAVRPAEVTSSAARLELLDDLLREIERLVGRDDAAVGRAHVEDHGVVARGPHALDDTVDLGLDRIEQLALPAGGALLQLLGALLELLLLRLEILPLGGPLRRAQHDALLLEVRGRGVQAGLELLDLSAVGLQLLGERGLGLRVPRRRL